MAEKVQNPLLRADGERKEDKKFGDNLLKSFSYGGKYQRDGAQKPENRANALGASHPDKNLTSYDASKSFIDENPQKLHMYNTLTSDIYRGVRNNLDIFCDKETDPKLLTHIKNLRDENKYLREKVQSLSSGEADGNDNAEQYENLIRSLKKNIERLNEKLKESGKMIDYYRKYSQNCIDGAYNQVMLDTVSKQVIDCTTAHSDLIRTMSVLYENAQKMHLFIYLLKDAQDCGDITIQHNDNTESAEPFKFDTEFDKIKYMFENGSFTTEE